MYNTDTNIAKLGTAISAPVDAGLNLDNKVSTLRRV
jgi:hypothetical protein